jgi:hypothetical protein
MARRQISPQADGAVRISGEIKLDRHLLVFDDDEVIQLLRVAVEREGNQIAFARRHDIERTGLNMMLNGKRSL